MLKKNRLIGGFALIGLFSVAILSGCAGTKVVKAYEWPQVIFANSELAEFLEVRDVKARFLDSGSLQTRVRIFNVSAFQDLPVRVKFKFFDKDKAIADETSWMPYTLTRREETDLVQNSISNQAKDFNVIIDWQSN